MTQRRTIILPIYFMLLVLIASQPALAQEDRVLATVNGFEVKESNLQAAMAAYRQQAKLEMVTEKEMNQILQGLIQQRLILQQKEVNDMRNDPDIIKLVKIYENKILIDRYLGNHIRRYLTVTDEEVAAYYNQNLTQFAARPKVQASHILLRSRKDAEMVKAKLDQGADFNELARQYSIDLPMALEGGSMGEIEKGKTVPALENVLFILDEGQIGDQIVETQYGFHILRVDKIIMGDYQPLENVRDQVKSMIMLSKESQAFEKMASELEKNADIKIFEDRVKLVKSIPQ
jgi:parvulin-like peptidyl-prolyl isomerase